MTFRPTQIITREQSLSSSSLTCASPSERRESIREVNSSQILRPVPIRVVREQSSVSKQGWGMEVKFSPNSAFVTPNAKTSAGSGSTECRVLSSEKELRAFRNSGVKTLKFDESDD